ncbi:MAG: hypothetical protein ACYS74_05435, partial [Planctomycetota bacterium]
MMLNRRDTIKAVGGTVAGVFLPCRIWGRQNSSSPAGEARVTRIEIARYRGPSRTADHLEIVTDSRAVGRFGPLGWGLQDRLREMFPRVRTLIIGKDPLDRKLEFGAFWDTLYPDHPLQAYADGIDPLSRQKIWGT